MGEAKIKTLSLVCPSCGGKMELSADGEKAVCPYCGHEMIIDTDDSTQDEYERRIAMARAEEDIKDLQSTRQRKRRLKGWLIALCIIAGINLIGVLIPASPMHELVFPRTADPFTAVSLKFSGMSGEGRAELQISDHSAEYADTAGYGSLQGFNFGYNHGFSYAQSFSGWTDAAEMEADLRHARDGYHLVD